MIYIGVDIGKDGGIAIIDVHSDGGKGTMACPMPTIGVKGQGKRELDLNGILENLRPPSAYPSLNCKMVIEDATINPQWSKSSGAALLGCRMAFEAFAVTLGISYEIRKARIWQKEIFNGMDKTDTKIMALTFVKGFWPGMDLTATERSTVPHSGMVDALCIAEYCRRINS